MRRRGEWAPTKKMNEKGWYEVVLHLSIPSDVLRAQLRADAVSICGVRKGVDGQLGARVASAVKGGSRKSEGHEQVERKSVGGTRAAMSDRRQESKAGKEACCYVMPVRSLELFQAV